MTPDQVVQELGRRRVSAILRCDDPEVARKAMEAAIRGGCRIVEFTMTIPGVLGLVERFAARGDVVVGAGTVMTPGQAEDVVSAGGRFLVSPVTDPEVIETAHRLGVAVMPGTHTPTEMMTAHRAGAQLCKLFPAPGIGPSFVRSVLGPLPFLRIVPTNGVDADNLREWLDAGSWAVGLVAPLFRQEDLESGHWSRIEDRARRFVELAGGEAPPAEA